MLRRRIYSQPQDQVPECNLRARNHIRHSGEIVYKSMLYDGVPGVDSDLIKVSADFHQYYKILNKRWTTFLHIHKVEQCGHDGNDFCPWKVGDQIDLKTVHPPLGWYTPYGWYRSRQIWRNGRTGEALGCVDLINESRVESIPEEEGSVIVNFPLRASVDATVEAEYEYRSDSNPEEEEGKILKSPLRASLDATVEVE